MRCSPAARIARRGRNGAPTQAVDGVASVPCARLQVRVRLANCAAVPSPGAAVRNAHDDSHRLAIVTRFVGSGCANSYRLHAVVAGNGSILPDSLPLSGTARSRLPPLRPLPGFADRAGLAIGDDSQRLL